MYLWRVDKLIEDFRHDDVSEKEKLKYMLLVGAVGTVASDPILSIGLKYSTMDAINLLLMLVVVLSGTYYCYVSNRNADNKDFVTRFLCIGLPTMIRIFAIAIPIIIVIGVAEGLHGVGVDVSESGEEVYTTTVSQVVGSTLLMMIYFLYLGKKLKFTTTDRNT